jgi:hypothetical protein
MWRILFLTIGLIFSPLHLPWAKAVCSVAPNEVLVKHTVDASGIEFSVTPADSGCPATQLSYAFVYFDQMTNSWDKWTDWMIGSTTGKAFAFKVPAIKGKSRVIIGIAAKNKWGQAPFKPYGASFQSTDTQPVNPIANTIISARIRDLGGVNRSMKFEISHPDTAVCSDYRGSSFYNCDIPMSYRITSDDPKSWFYGNGKVYTEAGTDVGYFGNFTFTGDADSQWRSSTIRVAMPITGKVYLSFTGAGNGYDYNSLSKTTISLFVKTAEQVAAERAAAAKIAAEKEAAEKLAQQQRQAAKKLTINCWKGKTSKVITGESPTCPKGYKNPMASFGTFQAFSICQLYKKDSSSNGAKLADGGRTLILSGYRGWLEVEADQLTRADYECAIKVMKMPEFVASKITATRAIDGIQSAQWERISAFWNRDSGMYSPSLYISFNSK